MNALDVDDIAMSFGSTEVLTDVSLTVPEHSITAVLGSSGSGKTTLLRIIAGFERPKAGRISLAGRVIESEGQHVPPERRRLGYVPQEGALFPHLTVARNVGFGLRRGTRQPGRVEELLELVNLPGLGKRYPHELSGGQQQRVALARALVINPTVLLLDEPFSALDKNLRASMQVELREIQRKLGVTTIFVTHDQGEALSLSDRIAVMSEGRIRQLATPEEIYRRPCDRFVASFVGDANILRGRLERVDGSYAIVATGAVQIRVPRKPLLDVAPSAPVDLFVRPEHLCVTGANESSARSGAVVAQIYQGGHVDLYVECTDSSRDRLLVRSAGYEAMVRWPVGTPVGISISTDEGVAFAVV
jgi:putative spermidine/putrescine transport system ATP-binding protein